MGGREWNGGVQEGGGGGWWVQAVRNKKEHGMNDHLPTIAKQ